MSAHDDQPPRDARPQYFDVESAASMLQLTPEALRARCRRNARRVGKKIIADLGDGVYATKFGRSWRIRFPAE